MKYYKVKKEYDQTRRKDGSVLIANELYTKKEVDKYHINKNMCDEVNISKHNIYFCFGARFA